jgi:ATP-dependent helicase/nuclease subunit A
MQPSLFDDEDPVAPVAETAPTRAIDPPAFVPVDQAARDFAVDPRHHVLLEASAGTGKTRVLVDRFVRLLDAGVDPRHILAITFTRKAAAEMRDRVLATLAARAQTDRAFRTRWHELADRVADIQVSTIDAFCFSLLREFPLEAGVDPAFEVADETEMARFSAEALDLTFRAIRGLIIEDPHVRLLLAEIRGTTLRDALASLIDRRHLLVPAVATFVARHVRATSAEAVAAAFVDDVAVVLSADDAGPILRDGPRGAGDFAWLAEDLAALDQLRAAAPARVRQFEGRLRAYFLNKDGGPRSMAAKRFKPAFASDDSRKRHDRAIKALAPRLVAAFTRFDAGVDGLLARGLLRVLAVATRMYESLLEEHALLDFAGMLDRAVTLLSRQEEFARSRLKLQSRYHHVLVDEFQDTSRPQWRLIELLIDAWSEGDTDTPTSIFVVGDRKQSIYRFRQAEVALLDEAARKIGALSGGRSATRSITHSFRAVPELLAFVNAIGAELATAPTTDGGFRYDGSDRFPVPEASGGARRDGEPVLGLIAEPTPAASAAALAAEIERLLATATVRDRHAAPRRARPDDIAILFRTRAGHRVVEEALAARGIRSYVYKGLGFFDAPEVQDLQALLRYLARPDSDLTAAEWLRSRFVRLSDVALARLAPDFSRAILDPAFDAGVVGLDATDLSLLVRARTDVPRWLAWAAHLTPGVVVDRVMADSAYMRELSGRRLDQARENVKKVRALIRRVENRGYATLDRIASYFETLGAGEESNAIVAASGCVHLMTIHAAKGLEFPIVFLVNLHAGARGAGPISVLERDTRGEPHVAFGKTAETEAEERRNRDELRRLLYVAVTRARDRLYLSGDLDGQGRLLRRQSSLAQLLPAALADRFADASAGTQDEVTWAREGESFALRVCRAPAEPAPMPMDSVPAEAAPLDIGSLQSPEPAIVAAVEATDHTFAGAAAEPDGDDWTAAERRLLGTIVHRVLARGLARSASQADIESVARAVISPGELGDVRDVPGLVTRAAAVANQLRQRADVVEALEAGRVHFEVPFSYRAPDRPQAIVRGAVDCLVETGDGRFIVLEFKTGQRRPAHADQAGLYVAALECALGKGTISAQIIYP